MKVNGRASSGNQRWNMNLELFFYQGQVEFWRGEYTTLLYRNNGVQLPDQADPIFLLA